MHEINWVTRSRRRRIIPGRPHGLKNGHGRPIFVWSNPDRVTPLKRMQRVFGDIDALRFVDNRLDEDRRSAFLAHLAEDPEEAERVESWSRQNDAIRAAFSGVANEPVPLWLRLGNVASERSGPSSLADGGEAAPAEPKPIAHLVVPLKRRASRTKGVSVALLAMVAAGSIGLYASRDFLPLPSLLSEVHAPTVSAPNPMHALLTRAADAYRTYAIDPVHPVEIASTQQPQLERWLQRRLSIPVQAPDLRSEGWSLLGGRLAPGDFGPGAYFVYENQAGDRMGLYIARTGAAPKAGLTYEATPGATSVSWISGPVGIVLSTGKDVTWMSQNIEMLRHKIQITATN
jgi:anti-sigma factor RsiW